MPNASYDKARKDFAAALMEWQKGKALYPDANSTMRLTYGHVLPYSPKDALKYEYYTTAQGLLEKEDPTNPEFILPAGIKSLLLAKDYGRWAAKGITAGGLPRTALSAPASSPTTISPAATPVLLCWTQRATLSALLLTETGRA